MGVGGNNTRLHRDFPRRLAQAQCAAGEREKDLGNLLLLSQFWASLACLRQVGGLSVRAYRAGCAAGERWAPDECVLSQIEL